MSGGLRITAGRWRSRAVRCPDDFVRPTTSWAREVLFAWLGNCSDSVVLDCTAGSGILGFEALSRGAAEVIFWDIEPKVLTMLQENTKTLQAQAAAACVDIREVGKAALEEASVDILFYDPPYAAPWAEESLSRIVSYGWVKATGWMFFESHQKGPETIGGWSLYRHKKRGSVCLNLYRQHNSKA